MAALLRERPLASGVILDLPHVAEAVDQHLTRGEGLEGRCAHLGGDMFARTPQADVYLLKHILHDWNDAECEQILAVIRKAAKPTSRLVICGWVVPGPDEPHLAKLVDIQMLCVLTGRERTVDEYDALLAASCWRRSALRPLEGSRLSILEAVPV
jgi:hypothetical protein